MKKNKIPLLLLAITLFTSCTTLKNHKSNIERYPSSNDESLELEFLEGNEVTQHQATEYNPVEIIENELLQYFSIVYKENNSSIKIQRKDDSDQFKVVVYAANENRVCKGIFSRDKKDISCPSFEEYRRNKSRSCIAVPKTIINCKSR
jgi:hypothetical protein